MYDISIDGCGMGSICLLKKDAVDKPWTRIAELDLTLDAAMEMRDALNAPPATVVAQDPDPTVANVFDADTATDPRIVGNAIIEDRVPNLPSNYNKAYSQPVGSILDTWKPAAADD